MRYRVDYYFQTATEAIAVQLAADAENAILAEDNLYQRAHGPAIYQDGDSHLNWMATGGGWFSTQAKARKLQRTIETAMKNDSRVIVGSIVELHPCNNEDSSMCDPASVEYLVKVA